MKKCFRCGVDKPLDDFYPHKMMADGHLGKCKECAKKDSADRYEKMRNDPEWLERERRRCREKQARYRLLGTAQETTKETKRRWEFRNKHKRHAQVTANNAFRDGKILKPSSCSSCGLVTDDLEKHHEDYSQPLSVKWLCIKCHGTTRHKTGPVQNNEQPSQTPL